MAEAKSAVAAIETGRSIGAAPMAAASNDQIEEIQAAVFASNKIKAIKLYRAATGEGLKESKDFIDALENELRRTEPGKYTGPAAKGLRHGGSRGRVSWGLRWLCCRWPMKPRSIDARPQK